MKSLVELCYTEVNCYFRVKSEFQNHCFSIKSAFLDKIRISKS